MMTKMLRPRDLNASAASGDILGDSSITYQALFQ
jgi:hypothetical protein